MRRATIAAAIGAVALMGTTLGANASAQDRHQSHPGAGRLDHVYVLMLENHSRSSVIDNPNAPYITKLAHTYTMADHYYGVTHPSMPNYIASIAGDNFGIQDDNDQNVVNLDRAQPRRPARGPPHPVGRLHGGPPGRQAGPVRPERADGTQIPLYAKKHNPFVLFDDIKNNPARMAKIKDYTPARRRPEQQARAAVRLDHARTSATTCTAASTTRSPGTRRPRARTAAPRTTPTTPPSSRRPTRS